MGGSPPRDPPVAEPDKPSTGMLSELAVEVGPCESRLWLRSWSRVKTKEESKPEHSVIPFVSD